MPIISEKGESTETSNFAMGVLESIFFIHLEISGLLYFFFFFKALLKHVFSEQQLTEEYSGYN